MIKFWITNRLAPGQSVEDMDYNWGVVHLSLMLTTTSPMNAFRRYVQHRSVDIANDADLLIPRSEMNWYGIADHWVDDFSALVEAFTPEYARRMQPHNFADSAFTLELTEGRIVVDQDEPFTGRGGVKLVQFLRAREGVHLDDFNAHWQGAHADLIKADSAAGGPVRRYVQNPQLPLDPAFFAGTLFELGGTQTYAGIEELWFDDLDALLSWAGEPQRRKQLADSLGSIADLGQSFAMPVVERVVFDRTLPGAPHPAILNPDSFEAQVVASEREASDWRTVQPVTTAAPR